MAELPFQMAKLPFQMAELPFQMAKLPVFKWQFVLVCSFTESDRSK
jgi:hypothetical protein